MRNFKKKLEAKSLNSRVLKYSLAISLEKIRK